METLIRSATPTPQDGAAFAELAEIASNGTFRLLLGSRADRFLRTVFVLPGHELSYERTTFAVVDGDPVGMLVAVSGQRRRREQGRTNRVVLRHAGVALPRMGLVALLLTPVLRVQSGVADDEFYVQMVAVAARWRGRGYGKRLMAVADAMARDAGCGRVVLDVEETNTVAIGLYRSLGFETLFRSRNPWIVPKPAVLRMAKKL